MMKSMHMKCDVWHQGDRNEAFATCSGCYLLWQMGIRKGQGTVTHQHRILQFHASLTVIQRLSAEEAQAVEVEDGQPKQQILVEEEQDHAGDAGIGPAAMH